MSTGFDELSLRFLLDQFRDAGREGLPSGEVVNARLLKRRSGRTFSSRRACARWPISSARSASLHSAYSTAKAGARALTSSAYALAAASRELRERVTLFLARPNIPAPYAQINLCAMGVMRRRSMCQWATPIIRWVSQVSLAAVGLQRYGDRTTLHDGSERCPEPDHARVAAAGRAHRARHRDPHRPLAAMGHGLKVPTRGEFANRIVARETCAGPIRAGEAFTVEVSPPNVRATGVPRSHTGNIWVGRPRATIVPTTRSNHDCR